MPQNELNVDISEVFRLLGGVGSPPEEMLPELESAAAAILIAAQPRVVSKHCKILRENGIVLEGTSLCLTGKSIEALLHDCEECVIFCATLGAEVDAAIRKAQIRDVALAAMLDASASVATESLCEIANREIADEYAARGKFLTDRFSPGYGDLPVEIQRDFCAALDTARRIGVVVGSDYMMTPMKSVTAVTGIADKPQKSRETGCEGCARFSDCKFRERGVTCYGQVI
ncbi:MAG: hypothetical protein EOM14_04315 [Clostridia bacterium]|nr:hypothetical protein [Clostridia bacterium]